MALTCCLRALSALARGTSPRYQPKGHTRGTLEYRHKMNNSAPSKDSCYFQISYWAVMIWDSFFLAFVNSDFFHWVYLTYLLVTRYSVGKFTLTMWCRYILSASSIMQEVGRGGSDLQFDERGTLSLCWKSKFLCVFSQPIQKNTARPLYIGHNYIYLKALLFPNYIFILLAALFAATVP
jgi:hypothetical protein